MDQFDYLIERIEASPIVDLPFAHLHVAELFSPEHFAALLAQPEIAIPYQTDDAALIAALERVGYRVIDFPGCLTDRAAYCRWRAAGGTSQLADDSFEGEFGMVLRLVEPRSEMVQGLFDFLASPEFVGALAARFGIDPSTCVLDGGIQKYLDGYQISPHPDIRRKALTWMANIYPGPDCEGQSFHTQYQRLRPEYAYVQSYWEGNRGSERCHLPWHTATTDWHHRGNNSLVAFAPGDATLHAVKAWYDHLGAQRTQIYGNLWYADAPALQRMDWPDLQIAPAPPAAGTRLRQHLRAWLPAPLRKAYWRLVAPRAAAHVHLRTTPD